jgi:UDP-4-amino-4,6-dideoxy-N-acetyl-beta-L-altrosamine transaminase
VAQPLESFEPVQAEDAPLPYGRHLIDEADIAAVVAALRSDRLAHGPKVGEFESAFAATTESAGAAACSSGTAALHLALATLDLKPGDLCIVPAVTFLATATAARFCGAEVAFADVDPASGLMTADSLGEALARAGGKARCVIPVHLGGRICAMDEIAGVARAAGLAIVEDACHALGGRDAEGQPVGACALSDAAAFSLHPVKTIAAGEGGMATSPDPERAARMRRLANHGVTRDAGHIADPGLSLDETGALNPWSYEQAELGFNYRMDELSAALGLSQLSKLERFVRRRRELALLYDLALEPLGPQVRPVQAGAPGQRISPHLHQVLIDFEGLRISRAAVMRRLADRGAGTQVHYIPLYRQPYFARRYGEMRLQGAEAFYERVLALPLFPAMRNQDVERVAAALAEALGL